MQLFGTVQLLAFVAVVIAKIASAAVLSQVIAQNTRESENTGDNLRTFLRLTRDVDNNEVYQETVGHVPCSIAENCWQGRLMEFLREILQLNFNHLFQHLDSYCTHFNASSCNDDSCDSPSLTDLVQLGVNVEQWACRRQEAFQKGAACWADPFQETMSLCQVAAYEATNGMEVASILRSCFKKTMKKLGGCSLNNQKLFKEFSDYVIDEHLNYYT